MNNMAEKNIVWLRQKDVDDLDQDAGWCNVYSYEPAPPSREATLVVHEGKAERVFTESEVRAMLDEMEEDIHEERYLQQFRNISRSHGISDPA